MAKPTLIDNDARITVLETQFAAMNEKVDYLNKIIVRGNGKPSLIEEVHTVVQFMNDFRDNYKYWSRWVIAGILANIIGFTSAALLWFIKIAPLLEKLVTAYPLPGK